METSVRGLFFYNKGGGYQRRLFKTMNNFIYENSTKVYFGAGCVKEFLTSLVKEFDIVMWPTGRVQSREMESMTK